MALQHIPCVVEMDANVALAVAVERAFLQLGESQRGILVLPHAWRPTVEVVPAIVEAVAKAGALQELTLVHPSAAMSFIASSVGIKLPLIAVRSAISLEDSLVTGPTPITVFTMQANEMIEAFVHRSARDLRTRAARRGILVLDPEATIGTSLGDVLVDELLQNGVLHALALVHPTANLEVVAASVRLRLPRAKILTGRTVATAERALDQL